MRIATIIAVWIGLTAVGSFVGDAAFELIKKGYTKKKFKDAGDNEEEIQVDVETEE